MLSSTNAPAKRRCDACRMTACDRAHNPTAHSPALHGEQRLGGVAWVPGQVEQQRTEVLRRAGWEMLARELGDGSEPFLGLVLRARRAFQLSLGSSNGDVFHQPAVWISPQQTVDVRPCTSRSSRLASKEPSAAMRMPSVWLPYGLAELPRSGSWRIISSWWRRIRSCTARSKAARRAMSSSSWSAAIGRYTTPSDVSQRYGDSPRHRTNFRTNPATAPLRKIAFHAYSSTDRATLRGRVRDHRSPPSEPPRDGWTHLSLQRLRGGSPTYSSWINQIERLFAEVTRDLLQRSDHHSELTDQEGLSDPLCKWASA